ncbi:hypothetical protein CQW23_21535 [Capsicum baccatum]|uniref:Uncharacterized protein n=1 Tax=Capsicum baccatum TaxID=33114 RepID=A0A2G2VYA9_CAPBA|nr:hypothetical protein CQW23_21535 [Capsicum baccatum]
MCALKEIGSYSHTPKKLDLDLTNQPSQAAMTSIVEPPMLESKELPKYLRYTFLGYGNTLSESVADDLSEQHVEALISTLMRYKRAMGRKIDDIIDIPPGIYMHKSHLEQDCMPTSTMSPKDKKSNHFTKRPEKKKKRARIEGHRFYLGVAHWWHWKRNPADLSDLTGLRDDYADPGNLTGDNI